MKQEMKQNNVKKSYEKEMSRANKNLVALADARKLTNADIARAIGDVTGQAIGNYMRGRPIPLAIIQKIKEVYGVDLANTHETHVSRETMVKERSEEYFQDRIFHGDYIGMHNRAWNQLEETLNTQRELLRDASARNNELVASVSKMVEMVTLTRTNRSK